MMDMAVELSIYDSEKKQLLPIQISRIPFSTYICKSAYLAYFILDPTTW